MTSLLSLRTFLFLFGLSSVTGSSFQELSLSNDYSDTGSPAVYGDFAVVGTSSASFGASVFRLDDTTGDWYEDDQLSGDGGVGFHVSLSSEHLFVSGQSAGEEAHVYELDESSHTWIQKSVFTLSNTLSSAVIGDNYLVAGNTECSDKGTDAGCVYVWIKEVNDTGHTSWNRLDTLYASDPAENNAFGGSVDLWNDRYLIVGAEMQNVDKTGAAYIFELNETDIVQVARLQTNDTDYRSDDFGFDVSIFENYAAVVSGRHVFKKWAVYFFEREESTGTWSETTKFNGSSVFLTADHKPTVSLFNDHCFIGSMFGNSQLGEVFIMRRSPSTGTWHQLSVLTNSIDPTQNFFGNNVDVNGQHAIVSDRDRVYMLSNFQDITFAPSAFPTTSPTQPTTNPTRGPSAEPTHGAPEPPETTEISSESTPSTTSSDIAGGAGAGAEANSRCGNNGDANDDEATVVVLVCLVCILVCTNIASFVVCKRRSQRKDIEDHSRVKVAIDPKVLNNKNMVNIHVSTRNLKEPGTTVVPGAVDIADTAGTAGTAETTGMTATEGVVTLAQASRRSEDLEDDTDELYVMMTKHGDDHIENVIGVLNEDDEDNAYGVTPQGQNLDGGMNADVPVMTNGGKGAGEKSIPVLGQLDDEMVTLGEGN